MARYVDYRCPECSGKFRWLHHPSDAPPPDRCPLCHAWVSEDEPPEQIFVPKAPMIKKSLMAKSWDQTARAIEEASIQRAKMVADEFGVPESEVSHMKITNMREPNEMREGDTAVISSPIPQGQTRQSGALPSAAFQGMVPSIPGYSPGTGGSPEMTGIMSRVRSHHPIAQRALTAAGTMGVYRGR